MTRQRTNRRIGEQLEESYFWKSLFQLPYHLGCQQRVATQIKEVVFDAHFFRRKKSLPDSGYLAFKLVGRRYARLARLRRYLQSQKGAAVDLAVLCKREF